MFSTDDDQPLYTLDNVSITLESTTTEGGLLTISKLSLRWQLNSVDHEYLWNNIMLHAIVRDNVPQPRIFLQLEDNTEVHLTPPKDVCDDIFAAMCKAAELNPDDEADEGEVEGSLGFNYDALLQASVPGQFDDAEVSSSSDAKQ